MGFLDRFRPTAKPADRGEGGRADRSPSIDRPTHRVTYRDSDGQRVERQVYSAVAADQIKADHPDAKIEPTGH